MELQNHAICCTTVTILIFVIGCCQALPRQLHDPQVRAEQCFNSPLTVSANDFGASLLQNIEENGNNIFISPLSIYAALAMTYLGAKGQTAREIKNAFLLQNYGLENSQFHEIFQSILNTVTSKNNEYNLNLANGIFVQKNFNIENKYQEDVKKFYRATVKTVDFANHQIATKDEINKFVSESTHNMISEFLKEPLSPDTVLALVNAIYFKGTWKIQFPKENTFPGVFQKTADTTKKVEYMTLTEEKFRFFEDKEINYKFLELPYKGGDISMLLAMPIDYEQTPDLEMDSEVLCRINGSLRLRKLGNIWLPKFQLKYERELKSILKQLGIRDLFESADLTGIRKEGGIAVSAVVHEAAIDVNEEGSEASAATGVLVNKMAFTGDEFIANHPFSFYIVDNRNGLILFSGRIYDP